MGLRAILQAQGHLLPTSGSANQLAQLSAPCGAGAEPVSDCVPKFCASWVAWAKGNVLSEGGGASPGLRLLLSE